MRVFTIVNTRGQAEAVVADNIPAACAIAEFDTEFAAPGIRMVTDQTDWYADDETLESILDGSQTGVLSINRYAVPVLRSTANIGSFTFPPYIQ